MRLTTVIAVPALLLGCGGTEQPADVDQPQRPDVVPEMPGPPPMPPAAPAESEASADTGGVSLDLKPAEVGVGEKGRGYGTGPVATPLKARWAAAERMVFDVQIPQAMNLYKATHGDPPASHDQFMAEIIEKNQINLPELPQGERYHYDPERAQLMVVEGSE
jgi:hypothetical protein